MMTITATKETMHALAEMYLAPEVPKIEETRFAEYEGGCGMYFTSSINCNQGYNVHLLVNTGKATVIIRERRYADDGKSSYRDRYERLSIAELRKLGMLQETADLKKT